MAEIATEYKPATSEEFDSFVAFCDSENGWKLCWENKDKSVRVWEQPVSELTNNADQHHSQINLPSTLYECGQLMMT